MKENTKELQLATAQARIDELERRAAGDSKRAQKEKERKRKQKAAKKAASGQEEEQQSDEQRAAAQASSNERAAAQQLASAARQHFAGQGSPAAKDTCGGIWRVSPHTTAASAAGCVDLRSGAEGSDADRFGGRTLVEERAGLRLTSGPRDAGVGAAVAAVTVWGLQVELELGPQRGAGGGARK